MNLKTYQIATFFIEPFLPLWVRLRALRGKEDGGRLRERYGFASKLRPHGMLLWLHAASVGEANSILLFVKRMRARWGHVHILVTTGTVTSAELMARRLPKEVIHQYIPLDDYSYTQRFMRHWKPEVAMFVESELWPNLIASADEYQCFMGILNGRMSKRSFASWQKRPALIRDLLSRFNCVIAQSEEDGKRFEQLGAKSSEYYGNLKYDADLLPCVESDLFTVQSMLAGRPVWLAASTHPGEELQIAGAHALLSVMRPNLLTIIVPRHPARGAQIALELKGRGKVAVRSHKDTITPDTRFYIADTLGELGLFYRLSETVFMGGSLVAHGGQNPLEAARLSCAVATGPHTENFSDVYAGLEQSGACLRVENGKALAAAIDALLSNASKRTQMGKLAKLWVEEQSGATDKILDSFAPIFEPK